MSFCSVLFFKWRGGINQMIMGEQGNLWQFIYAYTVEQQSSPTIEPLKDSTETVAKNRCSFLCRHTSLGNLHNMPSGCMCGLSSDDIDSCNSINFLLMEVILHQR